jgi:hypothetical protein
MLPAFCFKKIRSPFWSNVPRAHTFCVLSLLPRAARLTHCTKVLRRNERRDPYPPPPSSYRTGKRARALLFALAFLGYHAHTHTDTRTHTHAHMVCPESPGVEISSVLSLWLFLLLTSARAPPPHPARPNRFLPSGCVSVVSFWL